MLDAITYSYGGILSAAKSDILRGMTKYDTDIKDRFAHILQQCKTLLNLWPTGRIADYKSAMEMRGGVVKVDIYEVNTKIELYVDTFLLGL